MSESTIPAPTGGIAVYGVARSFGAVQAVRDVSFEARPGRVTGLIGPNGSGKTTLMLMLATLLAPDRGSIRIAGRDPVHDPVAVREVLGWMPDVLGSWASLSVRQTLRTTGQLYRFEKDRAIGRAEELIDLVDLRPLADAPTRVLSRGQKQRLSLARALVHDPSVLILDEPASGLDPGARIALRVLVRRLADEGRTVVVSSHVLAELDEMADDAVYLERGVSASSETLERARGRRREWRIRSLDPDSLRDQLLEAGIADADISGEPRGATVPIVDEGAAAVLLANLVGAGVRVVSFAPAVGDLEHTFLDLSSGGAAGETATGAPA